MSARGKAKKVGGGVVKAAQTPAAAERKKRAAARQDDGLILVVDVGNTTSVFGLFRGDELVLDLRVSSEGQRTADEYAAMLLPLFQHSGFAANQVGSMMVSSVVPPVNRHLERFAARYFGGTKPMFVEPGLDAGIEIVYDNPQEVGADRVVNAVAAKARWGSPVVAVDFGTATTFDVVDETGAYVGGVICPGLVISAEALFARASRLWKVDVRKPKRILAKNTAEAIQAGLYYGYIGLVDGILERLLDELPTPCAVVATGGQAELIASGSRFIRNVDPHLTLTGLRLICERNRRS